MALFWAWPQILSYYSIKLFDMCLYVCVIVAKELRGHSVMHQSWLTSSTGNAHDVSDEDDDEVDLSIAGKY